MSIKYKSREGTSKTLFYGWVVVAACTAVLVMHSGIFYSFSVFFKPLASDFGWSRAVTAGIQSIMLTCNGIFAIAMGWLADKHGPAKVLAVSGFLTGLGLVLTSRITALWQIYLTFGILTGIGMSANFSLVTATTARWFDKRRGLALGIVSSGMGLGTLGVVPAVARIIVDYGWSTAYLALGFTAWAILIGSSFFLRRNPIKEADWQSAKIETPPEVGTDNKRETGYNNPPAALTLRDAFRTKYLWIMVSSYFLFSFCVQMVMVHIVNYATDFGIPALVAATLVSVIGISSLGGRLLMGASSDRIGSINALVICAIGVGTSIVFLIFARELWSLYIVAVVFGFAYGGEVPQIPSLIGQFFGLRIAIVGAAIAGSSVGGAVGSLVAGQIFDATQSYQLAFTIGAISIFAALMNILTLKKLAGARLRAAG